MGHKLGLPAAAQVAGAPKATAVMAAANAAAAADATAATIEACRRSCASCIPLLQCSIFLTTTAGLRSGSR